MVTAATNAPNMCKSSVARISVSGIAGLVWPQLTLEADRLYRAVVIAYLEGTNAAELELMGAADTIVMSAGVWRHYSSKPFRGDEYDAMHVMLKPISPAAQQAAALVSYANVLDVVEWDQASGSCTTALCVLTDAAQVRGQQEVCKQLVQNGDFNAGRGNIARHHTALL